MKTVIFCLILAAAFCQGAEDVDSVFQAGMEALRAENNVAAVKAFAKALDLAEAAHDDAKAVEAGGCLFWSRKKLNLQQIQIINGDEKLAKKVEAVVTKKVDPTDADKWLADADKFTATHSDDPLRCAIAYYNCGERFSETAPGRAAIKKSLDWMAKVNGEKAKLAEYKPAATDGKAFVKCEPVGAMIILITPDGGKMSLGKAPSIVPIPVGRQTLELVLEGFKPMRISVEIDGKTIAKPEISKLEPLTVLADIVFEDGWMIFIDGRPAKDSSGKQPTTPCTIELTPGPHALALVKDGYMDIGQRIDVKEQTAIEIKTKPSRGTSLLSRGGANPSSAHQTEGRGRINLMSLVDVSKDAACGSWETTNGHLVASEKSKLQIPYIPPDEYDLTVTFARRDGDGLHWCVGVVAPQNGIQELFAIGDDRIILTGGNNRKPPKVIKNGQKCVLTLRVRKAYMEGVVDGVVVDRREKDKLGQAAEWLFKDPTALGIGSHTCTVVYESIELIELSGHGKSTR